MASVSFTVPGIPIAKARARVDPEAVRKGKKSFLYTPSPTKVYETLVNRKAVEAMEGRPFLDGPLFARIAIYRPLRKGMSQEAADNAESIWHAVKPDGDNVLKACLDGMGTAKRRPGGVYKQDSRIACCFYTKRYSKNPRVEIYVMELPQWQPKKKKKNGPQTPWSVGPLTPSCLTPETPGPIARSKLASLLLR